MNKNQINPPLSEYPRPNFYRDSYISLNGYWDYKISKCSDFPSEYDGKILVPFSPESKVSGVNHILTPDEFLFYHLEFSLDDDFIKDKVFLHFTAVDQIAEVYLNNEYLGTHVGGYLPFSFEIKKYLKKTNHLVLRVKDVSDKYYYSKGKQKLEHGGIWYTPQSGIWLPVWLESVNEHYIEKITFTPDIDKEEIIINVKANVEEAIIHIFGVNRPITCNKDNHIKVKDMHLWTPEDPYLYFVSVSIDEEDEVSSYFAMRKFSIIEDDNHIKRLGLNNKPLFMKGILDQGYYYDTLLTPPSYEAYVKDIKLVKSLGFNTIRKHIKIEIPRWYFECDKAGIIVWQDFVNGGRNYIRQIITWPIITHWQFKDNWWLKRYGSQDKAYQEMMIDEFKQTMDYLYNFPCIGLWTIFNEGWGQFHAKKVYEELSKLDKTRLFDHASGWHDQKVSDVKSMHVYFQRAKLPKNEHRAIILSEFGGLVYSIKDHMMDGDHVYKTFETADEWLKAYEEMVKEDVVKNIPKGLAASIYTQLSDVEEETNGFVTFDREVIKVDPELIKKINDNIHL